MTRFFIISLSFLFIQSLHSATTYTTISSGNWNIPSVWKDNSIPDLVFNSNKDSLKISENDKVTLSNSITLGNNIVLYVAGDLTIEQDLIIESSGPQIIVLSTGTLTIKGKLNAKNNTLITIDGELSVEQDLIAKNNSQVKIDGSGIIKGNIDFKGGDKLIFNGQVDVYGYIEADNNATITVGEDATYKTTASLNVYGNEEYTDPKYDQKLRDNTYGIIGLKNGNNLNGFGRVYLKSRTGTDPDKSGIYGFTVGGDLQFSEEPLPVKLIGFYTEEISNGLSLQWETASEQNNDYFILLRSTDLRQWEKIAIIKGSGTRSIDTTYSFVTEKPNQQTYYRLQQVDYDGVPKTLSTISFNPANTVTNTEVFPNPATSFITVKTDKLISISLLNSTKSSVIREWNNQSRIDISSYPKGIYFLQIHSKTGTEVKKIIIK